MIMNQHEGVKIIVIDGDGWRDGAVEWLYNASKNTDVLVMDLEEVYLRNIEKKLQQNNSLQEETNKLLKEILRELISNKS